MAERTLKNIYLIAGNFGVGKTTLVNAHPHEKIEGTYNTRVCGLVSLGGERGCDNISNYTKADVIAGLNPEEAYIIHGRYYQQFTDIGRYSRTHCVIIFYLRTSEDANRERIGKRGGKFSEEGFTAKQKADEKMVIFARAHGVTVHVIDNNRDTTDVHTEVWTKINDYENN